VNTHPFTQDGLAFAHNGVVGDLEEIEKRLGANRATVMGETDSERFFALIALAIRDAGADVRAGINPRSARWSSTTSSTASISCLANFGHIWAFRYPEHSPLHILCRGPGGRDGELDTPTPLAPCNCIPTTPPRRQWS